MHNLREYLLPENGQFYKANLHCHSNISDGCHSPEEIKDCYKKHGYSILAITDHELLIDHSDLNEPDFLMITGYEYAFCEDKPYPTARTIEFNLFSKDPHKDTHVLFNPKYVQHGQKERAKFVKIDGEPFVREYTLESMQKLIDEANKNGFLVSLNHPHYSMESPAFFGNLTGLFAMEIHNHGSYHYGDYNPQMYDQMLRMGHKISCIAADDSHFAYIYDDEIDKRPWGFSMIKAESLTYDNVITALEKGDFYATQGPEIYDLYVEDGKVHITCSDAKRIIMHTKYRHYSFCDAPCREFINSAEFNVPDDEYMRFSVIDAYGRTAATRAYFLK